MLIKIEDRGRGDVLTFHERTGARGERQTRNGRHFDAVLKTVPLSEFENFYWKEKISLQNLINRGVISSDGMIKKIRIKSGACNMQITSEFIIGNKVTTHF